MLNTDSIKHPEVFVFETLMVNQIAIILFLGIIILTVALIYFVLKSSFMQKEIASKDKTNDNIKEETTRLQKEISERTRNLESALQKAEESNRLKSLFLANMSHEIRTPLNGIMGFSELLVDNEQDQLSKQLFANQINQNSQNLLKLIEQIFHLSLIETGKVNINRKEFTIAELLIKFHKDINERITLSNKNIKLFINLENPRYKINSDYEKLELILENLFDNALKFTTQGIIELTCLRTEKNYLFQLSDSGCGIKEDEYDLIFDPFTQGGDTVEKLKGGSGLGLSNVKNYVILLGGKIWCEKNMPNGSIFSFTIPAPKLKANEILKMMDYSLYKN